MAEPGVGEAMRSALVASLGARNALGGPPLDVEILVAEWRPSRRAGTTLLYDARLVVRARAGDQTREVVASTSHADPGSAATPELRARAFEALAEELAVDLAAWAAAR